MILLTVLAVLVGLVALLFLVAAFRSPEFRVARSTTIAAPATRVFEYVNEFRRWSDWSPYEKMDPAMKRSFSGPLSGVGAIYAWEGNKKVGAGRMTIEESRPGELIRIKLEFLAPMANVCTAEFTFVPQAGGTQVTWSMSGQSTFVCRVFSLLMNMDKMVGGQFASGLAELKRLAEGQAARAASSGGVIRSSSVAPA